MTTRPSLAIIAVIVLLWLGIAGHLILKQRADLINAAHESRDLAQGLEENIRRSVEAIDTTIRALRVARQHDPAHFDLAALEQETGLTRNLTLQISLTDRTGVVIATSPGTAAIPVGIGDRDHFRQTRDEPGDKLFISRPVIGRISGKWSVQFVRKLSNPDGLFDGVIVASVDPAFLSRFDTSFGTGRGTLLLAGLDGRLRAVAPNSLAPLDADLSNTPLMADVRTAAQSTVEAVHIVDDVDRIYSWRRVDPYALVVAVGVSRSDTLADFRSDLRGCISIGIILTIIAVLTSMAFARGRRDLMRSHEILRAAVDNINQGLMVIDAERCVPVLNQRAVALLDLPADLSTAGVAFDKLLRWQLQTGEFDGPQDEQVRTLVQDGGIEPGETVYQRTRGNGAVLEVRTKTLENGLTVRTYTEITEQKLHAQVLADARDAAEAAMRARSDFLAVMSHEIRTPLNGVIGIAGLLEDMELGPVHREYVRLIRLSGDHLLHLVNDILDCARLEAERVQLEEVAFDPAELMRDAVGMFMIPASTKGLQLSAVAADAVPALVTGDPGRLRQILINLIGNAVKFTDQGWVSVALRHEAAAQGGIRLLFTVSDSGIGISADSVERMFEEFTQLDGSISRRFGGSGLGLAICRRLVELMGGTITVESQANIGSAFQFDIVLKPAIAAPILEPPLGAETGLRILLAEDNPTNRLVAIRILERLGHRADAVSTGTEVIEALALNRYDIVLMDVMMPDMDGLTATRRIRAAERSEQGPEAQSQERQEGLPRGQPDGRIVIVGLTAGSREENLAACIEAGMDAVTTKPISLGRLQDAIADGRAASAERLATAGQTLTPLRLHELAEALGADAISEIVGAFAEDTQAHLTVMRTAAARGDSDTIYRCAHSVSGAASNVGATALAERAATLEKMVGSLSSARIAALIETMQTDLDAALEDLATGAHMADQSVMTEGGTP